ncbi:helix-turn-helix domain-containing protein [Jiulongibacter sediminis]|uniref:helix-turn-helix domain-containing protein n=1 Tax=Jiulongibacter sediminis TaxID=1605367 RepID=UPI0026F146CA|nr:helix-turn-helix domain-containing protein [Jiulongibacter sediminis]
MKNQNNHKEILSRKETAKLLGIHESTLWAWTRAGRLKSYGIGHKVFYRYSEILSNSLIRLNKGDEIDK